MRITNQWNLYKGRAGRERISLIPIPGNMYLKGNVFQNMVHYSRLDKDITLPAASKNSNCQSKLLYATE